MQEIILYNGKPHIHKQKEDGTIILVDLVHYMQSNNIQSLPLKSAKDEPRSTLQNKSLHLYLNWVAGKLNEAGYDIKTIIKADVDWTMESVKELLWRPIQKIVTGKKSSANLTKEEFQKTQQQIDKLLLEKFGINIAFPSREFKDF